MAQYANFGVHQRSGEMHASVNRTVVIKSMSKLNSPESKYNSYSLIVTAKLDIR